jgi:hypothetical protein
MTSQEHAERARELTRTLASHLREIEQAKALAKRLASQTAGIRKAISAEWKKSKEAERKERKPVRKVPRTSSPRPGRASDLGAPKLRIGPRTLTEKETKLLQKLALGKVILRPTDDGFIGEYSEEARRLLRVGLIGIHENGPGQWTADINTRGREWLQGYRSRVAEREEARRSSRVTAPPYGTLLSRRSHPEYGTWVVMDTRNGITELRGERGVIAVDTSTLAEDYILVALTPSARRYHVVVVNDRTGYRDTLTTVPVTHEEGMIIKSKTTPHRDTRYILEEVSHG